MKTALDKHRIARHERDLLESYGRLLGLREVAEVLCTTRSALQRSLQRGQLPFNVRKTPGRRGYSIPASVLARYLASLEGQTQA